MTSGTDARVSVILASRNARATVVPCLEALRAQRTSVPFEVIIADSSTDGTDELIRSRYPEYRLLHFAERKFPGDARNLAIAQAHGEIYAFLDMDCTAAPDWVEQIWRAHASGRPSIGGVVENGTPMSTVGCAAYLIEFTQWMPQGAPRDMEEIPTCNLSIRRDAFERLGPFLEGTYCSDSAFHWRLAREGGSARLEPSIRVAHTNITDGGHFLRHEFFHGRSYARVRSRQHEFSIWKRLLYGAGSILLPPLLYWRIAERCLRHGRYRAELVRSTPLVFMGLCCWALGETRGYLD